MSSLEVFCSHAVAVLPRRCSVKKEERRVKHTVLNFIFFQQILGYVRLKFRAKTWEDIKWKILIQSSTKVILKFMYLLFFKKKEIRIFLNRYFSTLCFKYKYKLQEKGSYSSPLSTVLFCTEYIVRCGKNDTPIVSSSIWQDLFLANSTLDTFLKTALEKSL